MHRIQTLLAILLVQHCDSIPLQQHGNVKPEANKDGIIRSEGKKEALQIVYRSEIKSHDEHITHLIDQFVKQHLNSSSKSINATELDAFLLDQMPQQILHKEHTAINSTKVEAPLMDQLRQQSLIQNYSASKNKKLNASIPRYYQVHFKLKVADTYLNVTNLQEIISNVTGYPLQNISVSMLQQPVVPSRNSSSVLAISMEFDHRPAAAAVVSMIETSVLEKKILGQHKIACELSQNPLLIQTTNKLGKILDNHAYCTETVCPIINSLQYLPWMSYIPNSRKLVELTIPATHNTMARYGSDWAECQTMHMLTQLQQGIRGIDIRCRHYNNRFTIHHGAQYMHANFDDVLTILRNFLRTNPNEVIFMHIQSEYSSYGCTREWWQTRDWYFNRYPGLLLQGLGTGTTLGHVRGKVVVNFEDSVGGYRVEQNQWNTFGEEKWQAVRDYLVHAQYILPPKQVDVLYINYLSAADFWHQPYTQARYMNGRAADYLSTFLNLGTHGPTRFGIVYSDYPGGRLIWLTLMANFVYWS